MTAKEKLDALEERAKHNSSGTAWIYANCCRDEDGRCRLVVCEHPGFLHHGKWITRTEALALIGGE